MKYLLILALLLVFHDGKAQNVEDILIVEGTSIDSLRQEIKLFLFGEEEINRPVRDLDAYDASMVSEYYSSSPNLARIDKRTIQLKHGFTSVVYHFHPTISNGLNIPVIYHSGHGYGVFREDDLVNYNYGNDYSERVIDFFLSKGFDVIGIDMPFFGENQHPQFAEENGINYPMAGHDYIFYLENPFYYFLAPIKSVVNHYQKRFGCNRFIMFGLSGGGWATTVYSAIDPRICLSFPVAGSIPMPLRTDPRDYGDMEQYYSPFYEKYNYSTLYFLGAVGEGRMQYQVLNKHDNCCFAFDGNQYWAKNVQSTLEKLHLPGKFEFFYDTISTNHRVSAVTTDSIHINILNNLINDFLKKNNSVTSSSYENSICDNDTLLLSIPGFGNNKVQWFKNGEELENTDSTGINLIVSSEGTYYARIENISEAIVNTDSISVRRNLIFNKPRITEYNGTLCSPYSFGNQWYYNGQLLEGEKSPCIQAKKAGRYTIRVSSGECISDISFPLDYGVRLFPNPVTDRMSIRVDANLTTVYYSIRRIDGVVLEKGKFIGETVVNMGQKFNPGLYFLDLTNLKGFKTTEKFFVNR